jgi:adenine-specific DNA-methyltransferase
MEKLNKSAGQSMDIVAANIAKLKELFPEMLTENKIDFKTLQALLGEEVETEDERYSFNWHGKAKASQFAQTTSSGSLRPFESESKDWNSTKNIFIEGDNLEVLKLLQKSYHKKIKLIYIDPPYNTGKDFIYPDDFQDNVKNYLELTGQIKDGRQIKSNPETNGRFHTSWLNMMLPRLKLAKNLLSDDGALIVSIGDEELGNLIHILNIVFGESNNSANFCIVRSEGGGLAKQVVKGHDYLLVYAKNLELFQPLRRPKDIRGEIVDVDGVSYWIEEDWLRKEFGKYGTCPYDEIVKYHGEVKKKEIDEGLSSGKYRLLTKREGQKIVGRLRKVEDDSSKFYTVQKHLNANAADDLNRIGMPTVFDFPKPISLIKDLVLGGSFFSKKSNDIVMDFFAGSGTTGHAIMEQNVFDGGNRQFILVQLPEPLDPENKDQKNGAEFCDELEKPRNIAELTKERLRRAVVKIKEENPEYDGDLGFKVFKLDSSNLKPWDADFDSLAHDLAEATEVVKAERSSEDVLFEILLKYGLDLTLPIETHTLEGKTVYEVGAGALVVCLDSGITEAVAEAIGKLKETLGPEVMRVVFKDSGFANDAAKVNAVQVLKQFGIDDVKSI